MIQEKIQTDLKDALRQKDAFRLSVLRMVSAALHGKLIEKRSKEGQDALLSDEEATQILRQEAKKRSDSVQEFSRAGRAGLAEKESKESDIIQAYLPKELSDEALEALIQKVIATKGPFLEKDFGKAIGAVMKETKGNASGQRVQALVRKLLSA